VFDENELNTTFIIYGRKLMIESHFFVYLEGHGLYDVDSKEIESAEIF
jgi:hypothetical protein